MSQYHEPSGELSERDRDFHRALTSLMEEIEAIDWYHQRVVTCADDSLRPILAHNRDEEIEHAAMVMEWLRRNMPVWDKMLRRYLFTEAPITDIEDNGGEHENGGGENDVNASAKSLAIGRIDAEEGR